MGSSSEVRETQKPSLTDAPQSVVSAQQDGRLIQYLQHKEGPAQQASSAVFSTKHQVHLCLQMHTHARMQQQGCMCEATHRKGQKPC